MKTLWKKHMRWMMGWLLVFGISRLIVLSHPPYYEVVNSNGERESAGYSDVKHDYERYANMWYYGLTPYRKHLFEYPPGAIPLMLIPLWIDQAGVGHYYQNYRTQIFVMEWILFGAILYSVTKLPVRRFQKWLSLGFYILAGLVGKDFWYDGLDLVFWGSFTLGILWRLGHDRIQLKHMVVFWALFWLSVSIKLLTLPLLLPLFMFGSPDWKRELKACIIGATIVWIVPLVLYRSSLSVFLFFHGTRPLKYEAFGSFVIRTINDFSQTEIQSDIMPHKPMLGPVSAIVEKLTAITFPLALLGVLIWGVRQVILGMKKIRRSALMEVQLILRVALVYLFSLFLSSKILSRPFHIWYVPLIAVYPFVNVKTQVGYILAALLMIALDMSPYLAIPPLYVGPLAVDRLRDLLRFLPMIVLLVMSVKLRANPGKINS